MKINGNSPRPAERSSAPPKTPTSAPARAGGERVDISDRAADLEESRKLIELIGSGRLSAGDAAVAKRRVEEIHRKHAS